MNSSEIISILKQHQIPELVILEKSKNCIEIWDNYVHIIYHNEQIEKLFWDEKLKSALQAFQNDDTLDLVNKKGRLLKRFASFYKNANGEVIPDNIMGIMGDCLQNLITKDSNTSFTIDFTNSFDWRDGDFGKNDSCWWGCYSDSLPTFQQGGGWCIRFYDLNKNGIGRTWLYPDPECGVILGFNSYGIERAKVSKVIKKIFDSHGIELHYHNCSIENSNDHNIPYINGGTGFVLYTNDKEPESDYDLDMEIISDGNHEKCYDCGERMDIDDGDYEYINDNYYCRDCANINFSWCDKCEEYCAQDEVHSVQDKHSKYSYLCNYCANSLGFHLCEKCDDWSEYCIEAYDTGNVYCEDCADFFFCEKCENYFENETSCPDCEEEETEQDTDLKSENQIVRFKNGDRQELIVWYKNEIPGLIVFKTPNKKSWQVFHIGSGLSAIPDIRNKKYALIALDKFGELTNWEQITEDSLHENKELREKAIEVQNYIKRNME